MGKWLERLKDEDMVGTDAREPRQPYQGDEDTGFLGFQACPPAPFQRSDVGERVKTEATNNGSATDPDRWCWPHSRALNSVEIDRFLSRMARFSDKGFSYGDAERMAVKLVRRDRQGDDRRMCLECFHLQGRWRCGNHVRAGVGRDLPLQLVLMLQRCPGSEG